MPGSARWKPAEPLLGNGAFWLKGFAIREHFVGVDKHHHAGKGSQNSTVGESLFEDSQFSASQRDAC